MKKKKKHSRKKTSKKKVKKRSSRVKSFPKTITAAIPITFRVSDIVDDLKYDMTESAVTLDDVKEYIQEQYLEILSMGTEKVSLSDEHEQPV